MMRTTVTKRQLLSDPCLSPWHPRDRSGQTSPPMRTWTNYFDFSRTVVTAEAPKDPEQILVPSSSESIPQLDGIDDGTESDASEATNDGTRKLKSTGQAQKPNTVA